jgi:deoxyribonucleoside regulator
MSEQRPTQDRATLLANVAELYYLEEKNQAVIAKLIGVTRSMVSRMLTEARESGIVEIRIRRSVPSDRELELVLIKRFGLKDACVVTTTSLEDARLPRMLGAAGAQVLKRYLTPNKILGLAWGTSISATVDAFEASEPMNVRVVQMVGALGARQMEYDGHDLVARLSEKIGGQAYYLNAPFICQDAKMAKALLKARGLKETIKLSKRSDIALLGVGTTLPEYSSFYLAGSVSLQELNKLRREGAIGDVCGQHFDRLGQPTAEDFSERLVAIQRRDLLSIPIRAGVAGGDGKVEAILGALRGKYINVLVTESLTAKKVLALAGTSE